ncbi:hypothetical protein HK104_006207 [Borealophlyctis nickersoniae]|nr:hypothetical protein HK104_006207 [Borealophlyctis nickersoniae]
MRPDPHKAKATRKWKAKNGLPIGRASGGVQVQGGDASTRDKQPPPPDNRLPTPHVTIAPIPAEETDTEGDVRQQSLKFARRKLESNAYRYHEPTAEEQLAADAELDMETEDLLGLIRSADEDYDPATYFQFKEEREWVDDTTPSAKVDNIYQKLLDLDFASLDARLAGLPLHVRLGVDEAGIVGGDSVVLGADSSIAAVQPYTSRLAVPVISAPSTTLTPRPAKKSTGREEVEKGERSLGGATSGKWKAEASMGAKETKAAGTSDQGSWDLFGKPLIHDFLLTNNITGIRR